MLTGADLVRSSRGGLSPALIERIRTTLLNVGRALNSGELLDSKGVIQAMSELRVRNRAGGELGCSSAMAEFWEALLAFHPGHAVACLFPMGVAAAPVLGMERSLLVSPEIPSQEH